MLVDLLRTLPAAILAATVPGYFWTKLLLATGDRAERLAYSVALSMMLVPTLALTSAWLLGTGVSLPIAALSTAGVFATGLVLYLRFGTIKDSGLRVAQSPPPLGPFVLAPLLIALVLALGVAYELIPYKWAMIVIAPLIILAGVVSFFTSRREYPQEELEEASGDFHTGHGSRPGLLVRYLALPAVLALALYRGYSGPVLHDWPFIRGVDLYSHAVMSNLILTKGQIEPYLIYPPGFHTMIAVISRFSGVRPLEIFPVLAPALMVLPALALYALARKLWGWEYGVAAAFLSIIVGGTYYYFQDAMYPNLVTAQFLLVVALAALVRLYDSPSWRTGLLFALVGSSVVLYHQVASLYLALLLALVSVFALPYLFLRDRQRAAAIFSSFALLTAISVAFAWGTYNIPSMISGLLGGSGGQTDNAISMAVGTQIPYPLEFLTKDMVSQVAMWFGLLGTLLVVGIGMSRARIPESLSYLTLLLWALILFVCSRTTLSGFPQRFGRDLGIPLALFAALALVTVFRSLMRQRGALPVYLASLVIFLSGALIWVEANQSLKVAVAPNVQLTMTQQIADAGKWLREHNNGGNIMVSPQMNQVPSRMMLAMGGYSALQSFTKYQISHPRDLPPTGPKPLEDELHVFQHPASQQTSRLIKKYDVQYIVLYKKMPDRPVVDYWHAFEDHPNLYRTTFENQDVLIVARRGSTQTEKG